MRKCSVLKRRMHTARLQKFGYGYSPLTEKWKRNWENGKQVRTMCWENAGGNDTVSTAVWRGGAVSLVGCLSSSSH